MSELLPFIVAGLTTGAVYGLAGVGLVLTYKTSGVFNFAHGALATLSAFLFFSLSQDLEIPWTVSAFVCVFVLGPLMGVVLERLSRGLSRASLARQVAGTVGLALAIQAAIVLLYEQQRSRSVPVFLADGDFEISGTTVQWSDAATFAIALLATVALSIMFKRTRRGIAMRAVVDDPDLLGLMGTEAAATRRLAWMIGASFAAASGVLLAPLLPLDPVLLTLLVVQAFGAAAIGRFTSLPWTFAGGLIVGVLAALSTKYFTTGLLAGLPPAMPFVVLFAVLLAVPRRALVHRLPPLARRDVAWSAPTPVQVIAGVAVVGFLAFVPTFAGTHLTDWTIALSTTILFLSLGLLVRTSGQVSLCHVGFMAIGAAAFSNLAVDVGIPWLPALLLAGLVAVPIGALLAIPAIRLSGLYLALATFGFGVVLQFMFYTQDFMFGTSGLGLEQPRPTWFGLGGDEGFYYLVLGLVVVVTLGVIALDRSRLGRLLRALADSPTALSTSGAAVNVTYVLVFCLSAFLAAIAGALGGMAATTSSADSYQPLLSLTYFALVVIAVGREPWYALLAAGLIVIVPSYFTSADTATYEQLVFGLAALALAVSGRSPALPAAVRSRVDALGVRLPWPGRHREHEAHAAADRGDRVDDVRLEAQGVAVRFGGVHAVDDLALSAAAGRVVGLIGPNGAGKTTTFDVLSGLRRPNEGRVLLQGDDVTRRGAATRARRGIGRTFQRMLLFDSLTVRENVAIGAEAALAGANPVRHLLAGRGDARRTAAATQDALEACGIADLAEHRCGGLSTGQRRLVELARALAGPFGVLLLDEPSSGLDARETERFAEILRTVVDERGVGILLVEHDIGLVMAVCDEIQVLDFGRTIFRGTPAEVRASPIVRAAYLGDAAVEEAVV